MAEPAPSGPSAHLPPGVFLQELPSGEAQLVQRFLMVEFLMKSEPQGPDLMFRKTENAENREL